MEYEGKILRWDGWKFWALILGMDHDSDQVATHFAKHEQLFNGISFENDLIYDILRCDDPDYHEGKSNRCKPYNTVKLTGLISHQLHTQIAVRECVQICLWVRKIEKSKIQ